MSTNTNDSPVDGNDRDHRFHEKIMLSTRQIVESQEIMLRRIESSIEAGIEASKATCERVQATSAATEALLREVIESKARNQEEMRPFVKLFAMNNRLGIPNDRNPNVVIKGGHKEEADKVVENSSSETNKQQGIEMLTLIF
ncbi:hypothetical protein MKW94_004690, partial [Papaver nudicaule]|nr:hypothetical protein [Papaver nudicaule]